MASETKIGLLIGVALILIISVVVTDYLTTQPTQQPADLTGFGETAEQSVVGRTADQARSWFDDDQPAVSQNDHQPAQPASQSQRIPTPQELTHPRQTSPSHQPTGQDTPASPPRQIQPAAPTGQIAESYQPYQNQQEVTPPELPANTPVVIDANRNASPIIHYAKAGENLYRIAKTYYGNGEYWHSIAQANDNINNQTGNIRVGQRIVIPNYAGLATPAPGNTPASDSAQRVAANRNISTTGSNPATLSRTTASRKVVTVKRNDTLSKIAREHLGDARQWRLIVQANPNKLRDPNKLRPGMKLVIPPASGTATGNNSANPAINNTRSTPTISRTTTPRRTQPVTSRPTLTRTTTVVTRQPQIVTTQRTTNRVARPTLMRTAATSTVRPEQLTSLNAPPPSETTAASSTTAKNTRPSPFSTARTHTVKRNESLAVIARRVYGDDEQWRRIYDANRAFLSNPNDVKPGDVLIIPTP